MNRLAITLLALSLLAAAPVQAQDKWPSKPITIVVPFPPGGAADALPRIVAKYLSPRLGQPVILENKSGAGGNIGSAVVAKAAPDGYTLLLGTPGPMALNKFLFASMPFDSDTDFTPISFLARVANVLVVNPKTMPVADAGEFLSRARAAAPPLSAGNSSTGSMSHLSLVQLQQLAGLKFSDVAYRGSAPLVTDLLGGHLPFTIMEMTSVLPHMKTGALKVLAVTTAKPWFAIPDVPPLGHYVPGYEASVWFVIVGPKGMPPAVLQSLRTNIDQVLAMPEVVQQYRAIGADPVGGSPAEHISAESRKWGDLIRRAGLRPQ